MTTTDQQIAERLVQVVRETDWSDLDRIEDREKLSGALLDAGLREVVEKIEQGLAFKAGNSDKIQLLFQLAGYRQLLEQILAALKGKP